MATLNEIAFNIKNIASHGRASDDFNISLSQIKAWIKFHKNKILLEITDNGKFIPLMCEQDLGTVPIVKVDKADSPNVTWGENIFRVMYRPTSGNEMLPQFMKFNNKRGITFVGLVDKVTPIPLVDEHNMFLGDYNRFAKHHRRAYVVGDVMYLCLPNDLNPEYINLRGILEDPTKGFRYNGTSVSAFDQELDEYPFPEEHLPVLVDRIIKSELNATFAFKGDVLNNSQDDTQITPNA